MARDSERDSHWGKGEILFQEASISFCRHWRNRGFQTGKQYDEIQVLERTFCPKSEGEISRIFGRPVRKFLQNSGEIQSRPKLKW